MEKTGILHFKGRDKQNIKVKFDQYSLVILDHDLLSSINYEKLNLEIGGANNHLYFFKPIHDKSYSIHIPIDKELNHFLNSSNQDHWKRNLSSFNKAKLLFNSSILFILILLGVLFITLIQSRSYLADRVVKSIPYETEVMLGERLVSVMVPPSKTIRNNKILLELENMLAPLKNQLPKDFSKINFYISTDKELNAFAMPGGNIVINRGLLDKAEKDIEVLGVVAHELAHVTQRHVLRSMIQGAGLFLLIQTVLGDMTGLIAVLGDQGSFLLSQSFSRDMEREADAIGFSYLEKAKIPPNGLILFFEKIIKESEKLLGKELSKMNISFLSTHPDTEERIKEIQNMIDNKNLKLEYKKNFLKKIKQHLKDEK